VPNGRLSGNYDGLGELTASAMTIQSIAPTIALRDNSPSDALAGFLHVNGNQFYLLSGLNGQSWSTVNGAWPLVIDLSTNNAVFGGTVTATAFSGSGAALTSLNAGNVTTGTLAVVQGGTGTTTSTGSGSLVLNNAPIITGKLSAGTFAIENLSHPFGLMSSGYLVTGTDNQNTNLPYSLNSMFLANVTYWGNQKVRRCFQVNYTDESNVTTAPFYVDASGTVTATALSGSGFTNCNIPDAQSLRVNINANNGGTGQGGGIRCFNNTTTASRSMIGFYSNTGSLVATINASSTAVSYNTGSDYRLKEDMQPLHGSIQRLMELKPLKFKWKSLGDDQPYTDGFLAHEIASVVPQAVVNDKDQVCCVGTVFSSDGEVVEEHVTEDVFKLNDGNIYPEDSSWTLECEEPVYQQMDIRHIIPLLVGALQEAVGEIETLKKRLTILEEIS
jgi:hypothetical protein